MPERAYTVREIDDLREVCRDKLIWGRYSGPVRGSGGATFNADSVNKRAEDMVRTYMLAGLTAADLVASEGAQ